MGVKTITPDEYKALDRSTRRELDRSLEKQGLDKPDTKNFRQRSTLRATVDRDYLEAGQVVLNKTGMTLEGFLDLAFRNLILANNK